MPEFHTTVTIEAEQALGPFNYDLYSFAEVNGQLIHDGPFELENGAIYTGELNQAGCREGRGIQVWPDGSKYEGYWLNDKVQGLGRMIFTNGDAFVGEWIDSRISGKGRYKHKNGTFILGLWKDNMPHDFCEETWSDGAHFMGHY